MAKTLVYQLYPLAWPDGLEGMTQHLSRVADLGVDYVWLSPIYPSPLDDGGYDIANYKDIDRRYGRFRDFDRFVDTAHRYGIGVLMDLVLNHTSTCHKWFKNHPEFYCWSKTDRPGWKNLFNGGSAWNYLDKEDLYYLHLFHPFQADLNWFPEGQLNGALVEKFQSIVDFWVQRHQVDGFRLDVPQSINKNFESETLEFSDLLYGHQAVEVLNAVFAGGDLPFLMMECFDPTFGEITDYYAENTSVDYILNVLIKEEIAQGELRFIGLIDRQARNSHFMLDLESHDSPRFPSRNIVVKNNEPPRKGTPADAIWYLFNSGAEGICLYQGQELGLDNPTKKKLSNDDLLKLDAQTSMRYIKGEDLDALRPTSRANARIPLPLHEYVKQQANPSSYYNLTKDWIMRWRHGSFHENIQESGC
ncbi:hypothetical protein IKF21_01375 [Candidatus Saccharibacteria bacterium]|nr:hypothetical protein [Candidatus Saccharibacteria bacterium]